LAARGAPAPSCNSKGKIRPGTGFFFQNPTGCVNPARFRTVPGGGQIAEKTLTRQLC
jgi:hypothetical protein